MKICEFFDRALVKALVRWEDRPEDTELLINETLKANEAESDSVWLLAIRYAIYSVKNHLPATEHLLGTITTSKGVNAHSVDVTASP